MNQDRFPIRCFRAFLQSGNNGFRSLNVVCVREVHDDVEFRDDVRKFRRIEIGDSCFDSCFLVQGLCSFIVADEGSDIILIESEKVVEDLSADVASDAWGQFTVEDVYLL